MNKKFLLGTVAVFVAWWILDLVIHQVLLADAYEATASMWRAEMNWGLLLFVSLVTAAAFVYIYSEFVGNKSTGVAIKYGLVFGVGVGVGMAYGTYAVMDIPYYMALTWFLGTIVEFGAAGYIVALIVTPDKAAEAA